MKAFLLKSAKFCVAATPLFLSACNSGSTTAAASPGVTYTPFNCPGSTNVSFPGVSGIRQVDGSSDVYITGGYVLYGSNHGFLYQGPLFGGGVCYPFNYPTSSGVTVTSTSMYGPDNNGSGNVVVVGSYTTAESGVLVQHGMLYQGAADGSTVSGYKTLDPSILESSAIVINTLGHSTMGGLVVGNYDTNVTNGKAFIYNINSTRYTQFKVGLISTTVYGVWYNGGTSYTIAGGYSDYNESGVDVGYITDYDSSNFESSIIIDRESASFESLDYNNLPPNVAGTHIEGITTDNNGGYNLAADWQYNQSGLTGQSLINVKRTSLGGFAAPTWYVFANYPGSSVTSANTIYQNYVLGLYTIGSNDFGYIATIPLN